MNNAAEKLFNIIDSDCDGVITKQDLINICDRLELEEGPDAFLYKLGFQLDDDRPITLDDIYHCGLFDTVGQSDVSLNLAALAENNYEAIFDLLLVLQRTTTSYLRTRAVEIESELQQCNSEKENFRKELSILIQECEDRDRSITEFNLREKQLKQEIQSLYDQIDDCQARERTYTNESFRSRLGSDKQTNTRKTSDKHLAEKTATNETPSDEHICENCQRLFEDIANYENMIEQLNNEKKKMNVKVHAADTYLTQVKELESAYRNLEQHTMQMSSERDSILLEYEEMKGSFEELSQRYEELRSKPAGTATSDTLNSSFNNNLDTSQYTTFSGMNNTSGGFSFADELADTESKLQVEQLQDENDVLNTKIKQLEAKLAELGVSHEELKSEVSSNDVIPQIITNEDTTSLPDSGLARSSPQSPPQTDGICGHVLIGTAKLFLHCLRHDIGVSYSPPIVDKNGQVFGHLKVKLQRLSSSHPNNTQNKTGTDSSLIGDLLIGSKVTVHIGVIEANGIPTKLNNYVFCQYKFWDHKDMILPGLEFQQHLPRTNTAVFEHQETYTVNVTQSFLNYVNDGLLAVEVWGLRMEEDMGDMPRTGSIITTNASAPLYDRWSEMMTRLQLWVEILEINDNGIYSAVEVQERNDIKTGGIYQLRQGLSRRILVRVLPVGAGGNIACKSISSISIGNVHTQTRHQPALDSYQNEDLLKLRCAWSEALESVQNRIGEQLHRLTEKEALSDSEEEERGKLLEEWIRLLRERDAVLLPKENSGVPGARDTRPVPQGMESRIPTLFIDVNEQLRQNPKNRIVIGERSNLSGQDSNQMIKLTTVKHDQHRVCAISAWDSSTHETESLNCLTEPEQRVYLTLQVGVDVSLPYGMELELVLRKRVCVRVYKKKSLRDSMRGFMQDIPKRCGVMYEVVTGIPAFSNFYHENLNLKRTSTPLKDSNMTEDKIDNSNEQHSTLQDNTSSEQSTNLDLLDTVDISCSPNNNGLSELDDSIDPL
ncbi:hypothetical protein ACHWQZ_G017196 [Mnemiopsis leidyi]